MPSFADHLSDENLTAHLLKTGFDKEKVASFIQSPLHVGRAEELLKSYASYSKRSRKGRYVHLCLHEDLRNKDWVVFDPSRNSPCLPDDMLRLLVKFAIYKPGNKRFFEYNIRTQSLRLRSATILMDKQIVYTANGPVLQPLVHQSDDRSYEKDSDDTTSVLSDKSGSHQSELTEMESEE